MKFKISAIQMITYGLIVMFFIIPTIIHAQPSFGEDTDDVPIDGGLSLLVAAGVGYGIKKMKKNKRLSKDQSTNI